MRLKLLFLSILFVFFASCSGDSDPDPTPDPTPNISSSDNGNNTENSSSSDGISNPGNSSSSDGGSNPGSSSSAGGTIPNVQCTAVPDALDKNRDNLGLENAIVIKFNGNDATIENPYASQVEITKNGGGVVVRVGTTTTEYNLVVSGSTANGYFKVYGEYKVAIYLNGTDITNPNGPALNIQNSKKISVNLVRETKNYLTDGPSYASSGAEDAKGTLFSEGQLVFFGSGYLEVKGKMHHAIVSDDYLSVESGCITVPEAKGDGIHANDDVSIKGGLINITSVGDAIQSEKLNIIVSGGQVTANTTGIKSHGLTSFGFTSIKDNAKIDINVSGNGSKGIKSDKYTEILNGTINIQVTGGRDIDNSIAPPDTSNAAGIKADQDLWIEGGSLTIKSSGDKAKGINSNGSMMMTAGNINIEANDDGIKTDFDLKVTGGSGTVKSTTKKAIDCKGSVCNKGNLVTQDGTGGGL